MKSLQKSKDFFVTNLYSFPRALDAEAGYPIRMWDHGET